MATRKLNVGHGPSEDDERSNALTAKFGLPGVAAALVALTALTKLILHLATDARYGYFRDELYYIACSRHLDWGYVDQPLICPRESSPVGM